MTRTKGARALATFATRPLLAKSPDAPTTKLNEKTKTPALCPSLLEMPALVNYLCRSLTYKHTCVLLDAKKYLDLDACTSTRSPQGARSRKGG